MGIIFTMNFLPSKCSFLCIFPIFPSPDYHFVTREEMQKEIDAGEFIEHAEFSGNMYGTRWVRCPCLGHRDWTEWS